MLGKIKAAVIGAMLLKEYERLSVNGTDDDGFAVTYRLAHNVESFEHLDFDEITENQALNVESIATSKIVDRLLASAKKFPTYFG